MKQPTRKEENGRTCRRQTLDSLSCKLALLLSVVCCLALIHVELRIQEHHRLISTSVTHCDQMESKILQKVQQNNERQPFRGSKTAENGRFVMDHVKSQINFEPKGAVMPNCCFSTNVSSGHPKTVSS